MDYSTIVGCQNRNWVGQFGIYSSIARICPEIVGVPCSEDFYHRIVVHFQADEYYNIEQKDIEFISWRTIVPATYEAPRTNSNSTIFNNGKYNLLSYGTTVLNFLRLDYSLITSFDLMKVNDTYYDLSELWLELFYKSMDYYVKIRNNEILDSDIGYWWRPIIRNYVGRVYANYVQFLIERLCMCTYLGLNARYTTQNNPGVGARIQTYTGPGPFLFFSLPIVSISSGVSTYSNFPVYLSSKRNVTGTLPSGRWPEVDLDRSGGQITGSAGSITSSEAYKFGVTGTICPIYRSPITSNNIITNKHFRDTNIVTNKDVLLGKQSGIGISYRREIPISYDYYGFWLDDTIDWASKIQQVPIPQFPNIPNRIFKPDGNVNYDLPVDVYIENNFILKDNDRNKKFYIGFTDIKNFDDSDYTEENHTYIKGTANSHWSYDYRIGANIDRKFFIYFSFEGLGYKPLENWLEDAKNLGFNPLNFTIDRNNYKWVGEDGVSDADTITVMKDSAICRIKYYNSMDGKYYTFLNGNKDKDSGFNVTNLSTFAFYLRNQFPEYLYNNRSFPIVPQNTIKLDGLSSYDTNIFYKVDTLNQYDSDYFIPSNKFVLMDLYNNGVSYYENIFPFYGISDLADTWDVDDDYIRSVIDARPPYTIDFTKYYMFVSALQKLISINIDNQYPYLTNRDVYDVITNVSDYMSVTVISRVFTSISFGINIRRLYCGVPKDYSAGPSRYIDININGDKKIRVWLHLSEGVKNTSTYQRYYRLGYLRQNGTSISEEFIDGLSDFSTPYINGTSTYYHDTDSFSYFIYRTNYGFMGLNTPTGLH